jgi:hypothetical protein
MSAVASMVRAKGWLFDLFAHNHAEQMRIQRQVTRNKLGVEQVDLPYPGAMTGNTVSVHHHYQPASATAPPATATPAVLPPAPVASTPAAPPRYEAVYEEQQPDGSWKEIRREPL